MRRNLGRWWMRNQKWIKNWSSEKGKKFTVQLLCQHEPTAATQLRLNNHHFSLNSSEQVFQNNMQNPIFYTTIVCSLQVHKNLKKTSKKNLIKLTSKVKQYCEIHAAQVCFKWVFCTSRISYQIFVNLKRTDSRKTTRKSLSKKASNFRIETSRIFFCISHLYSNITSNLYDKSWP